MTATTIRQLGLRRGTVIVAAVGSETTPRWRRAIAAMMWVLVTGVALGAENEVPDQRRSPVERMTPARLKATHEDAIRIQASRRRLPPQPGLNDYRAILHGHAEDSAHTGGTRPEMLAEAKQAGVDAILLTDHYRPPRDFIRDGWRGLREGVLFIPGSENRGFLVYPTHSIMAHMKDATPAFIDAVRADDGLIFLSHIEERPDHAMTGLNGMEIYNRHADAKNDRAGVLAVMLKLTDPPALEELQESLRLYPDELFGAQVEYPTVYMTKWDAETKTRRLTGVAANDCHHNMILLVKMVDAETVKIGTNVDTDDQMRNVSASARPGIRALTKGRRPGDVLARVDIDPYHRSFRNVSTHILASELNETAIRAALREGHAYVSHDWMCDPSGFQFKLLFPSSDAASKRRVVMGDEAVFTPRAKLVAEFPVSCHICLKRGGATIAEHEGSRLEYELREPGVYRVEGWLVLDGEERGWIYSNPISIQESSRRAAGSSSG
jgi:hypothetical protein